VGIAAASGQWIAMMDADDIAQPERLERQLVFITAHPGLFLAASLATLFVEEGRSLGRSSVSSPATVHELASLKSRCELLVMCHPTFMFDAAKLRSLGGYDESFAQACDAEIVNRAVYEHGETVLIQPEELLWYRIASHGMSTKGLALQRKVLRYLEYRNREWSNGGSPIGLDVFLREPDPRPFRRYRHDRGALLYRQAGILVGTHRWGAAVPRLLLAVALHPRYALRKLRGQRVLRAVRTTPPDPR
jgi:glycosyltransferase involved in cell wall biosynthesis